ncbi:MAG: hypothetical protein MJ252_27695, partial [archaeon]|nr:hypothetical protein [archaeon]
PNIKIKMLKSVSLKNDIYPLFKEAGIEPKEIEYPLIYYSKSINKFFIEAKGKIILYQGTKPFQCEGILENISKDFTFDLYVFEDSSGKLWIKDREFNVHIFNLQSLEKETTLAKIIVPGTHHMPNSRYFAEFPNKYILAYNVDYFQILNQDYEVISNFNWAEQEFYYDDVATISDDSFVGIWDDKQIGRMVKYNIQDRQWEIIKEYQKDNFFSTNNLIKKEDSLYWFSNTYIQHNSHFCIRKFKMPNLVFESEVLIKEIVYPSFFFYKKNFCFGINDNLYAMSKNLKCYGEKAHQILTYLGHKIIFDTNKIFISDDDLHPSNFKIYEIEEED